MQVPYNGLIAEQFGSGMKKKYLITYWPLDQTMDDATNHEMSIYTMGADFILKD
jgi:hypothetical protein